MFQKGGRGNISIKGVILVYRGVPMQRLDGKICLVTGAASGIGKAISKLFVEEGAFVILTDIQADKGKALALELGGQAIFLSQNVRDEKKWQEVIGYIESEYGRLDVLVNNAGIIGLEEGLGPQDPENATLEAWREVNAINAESVFLGCKYALKAMKKHGTGSIINISSRSGMVGVPGIAPYAASKASVRNHTKSVALYCASQGYQIRCNSIHPASILTPIWDAMLGSGRERDEKIKEMAKNIPLGHMGQPEDVAYAALYLASDESKFVTGSELVIDGGILAGSAAAPKPKGHK